MFRTLLLLAVWLPSALAPAQIPFPGPGRAPIASGCSYSVTFVGTNGTLLTAHDANWVFNNGSFDIQSNAATNASILTNSLLSYQSCQPTDDQHASVVFDSFTSNTLVGPATRVHAADFTGYVCYWDDGNWALVKFVAGADTTLDSGSDANAAAGTILRLTSVGTSHVCDYSNNGGMSYTTLGMATDAGITSGFAGISGFDVTLGGTAITSASGGDE